ncbi:13934_t:CDS:1, partial [Dentiscutata erythropus]
ARLMEHLIDYDDNVENHLVDFEDDDTDTDDYNIVVNNAVLKVRHLFNDWNHVHAI